jgi:hypothetical protein
MSGLMDMFVRRRGSSESVRPGPHTQNGRYQDDAQATSGPEAAQPLAEQAPAEPVGPEPAPAASPAIARGQMRRRLRYLRQLRELQLRDIGGFLVECRRFGRAASPDVVHAKVDEAAETDRELRTLERALGTDPPLRELRHPGIGGACPECGSVFGSGDRFCAFCGHQL